MQKREDFEWKYPLTVTMRQITYCLQPSPGGKNLMDLNLVV